MSVVVPVYHYALLKGYLAAHGAPTEIFAAVEALYAAAANPPLSAELHESLQKILDAADRLSLTTPPAATPVIAPAPLPSLDTSLDVELPPLTLKMLEKANEPVPLHRPKPAPKWEEPGKVFTVPFEPNPGIAELVVLKEPVQKTQKTRTPWTEEQKEAARARMANARAAKAAKGTSANPRARISDDVPEADEAAFPAEITVQPPAARWKPSPIDPADWPDIQDMLAGGRSREAIAYDFDVPVTDLDDFIAERLQETQERHRQREGGKSPPGEPNGLAPAGVGSAA